MAFTATLTGGSSAQGVFAGTPGAVQAVALQGTPAPAGGTYNSFSDPTLSGNGQVAFTAGLTGGSSTWGVFAGTAGAVQAVAVSGAATPNGGVYDDYLQNTVLSAGGRVVYVAGFTIGAAGGEAGLFAGPAGSVQAVALSNTATPAGGYYSGFDVGALNGSGQVAFAAFLYYVYPLHIQGVFAGSAGAVQAAALEGTAAPAGGNYDGFGIPTINAAGQVAFLATLTGGSSTLGLFAGSPGAVQPVALRGTPAPAGGTYDTFSNPVLNKTGQVAFYATLTGGSASEGVFVGPAGAVQAVALQGNAAPGGGSYASFTSTGFAPALNGDGQVAFLATLTGAGVTADNDLGLYAGLPTGLVRVVRKGDLVDVDPTAGTDFRTVYDIVSVGGSGGEDGRTTWLADGGQLVYGLTFTDGSSGIFTTQLAPVPEPMTGLVVAAGLGVIGLIRRTRAGRRLRRRGHDIVAGRSVPRIGDAVRYLPPPQRRQLR